MNFNNTLKIIIGIFVTILLGAIGSGVWEKILSPFIEYLFELTTSTLESISSGYSDSIYKSASKIHFQGESDSILLLLFIVIFIWLFILSLESKKENKWVLMIHGMLVSLSKGWEGMLYSGFMLVVVFISASTQETVSKIRMNSLTKMDVLRPYIGDKDFHLLRSNYQRIGNKVEYEKFIVELDKRAKIHNIQIENKQNNNNET